MKNISDLLEPALNLAEIHLQSDGAINEKMKSDISSFGAAIQQCGLIPAIAMFSNGKSDAGKRHVKMLNLFHTMLYGSIEGKTKEQLESEQLFLEYVINNPNKPPLHILRHETMQACIAMKLAVRTFKMKESDNAQS